MKRKKTGEDQPGRFAYEGLDRVLHEKARLGIMTSLVTKPDGLLFGELKRLCALTDGNLSRHLDVLHQAALVEIWKGFEEPAAADAVPALTRRSPAFPGVSRRSSNRSSVTRCRRPPAAATARQTSRRDGSPPDPRTDERESNPGGIAHVRSQSIAHLLRASLNSQLDQMSVNAVACGAHERLR